MPNSLAPFSGTATKELHKTYLRSLPAAMQKKIDDKRKYFFAGLGPDICSKLLMDEEASFSVTETKLAQETTNVLLKWTEWGTAAATKTITDATACVGGNTINFADHFAHVHAIEMDPLRATFLAHNVKLACDSNKVTVHQNDALELLPNLKQDIVFFDPPWGGPEYANKANGLDLFLSDRPLADVCRGLEGLTQYIALKVPKNFKFKQFTLEVEKGGLMQQKGCQHMYSQGRCKFVIILLKFERELPN